MTLDPTLTTDPTLNREARALLASAAALLSELIDEGVDGFDHSPAEFLLELPPADPAPSSVESPQPHPAR